MNGFEVAFLHATITLEHMFFRDNNIENVCFSPIQTETH